MREEKGKSILAFPNEYVVIDTETTGYDYEYCSIIEISAVRYIDGQPVDKFTSLVKPPAYYVLDDAGNIHLEYVDEYITWLTGITNKMLEHAPEPPTVIPEFLSFVGDSILVAHNANFDINFIYDAALYDCNQYLRNDFIDTLRIARKTFPELQHHRLEDVAKACLIDHKNAHRAEADCLVTAQCFEKMRSILFEKYSTEEINAIFRPSSSFYSRNLRNVTATVDAIDDTNPIFGKVIVFTGALSSMERKDAYQIVVNLGGIPKDSMTKNTNYLVIGNSDFASSVKNGKTNKMKKAEAFQQKGCDITIISENAFFDMISDFI